MPDYPILTDYLRRWLAAVPSAGLSISVTDRQRTLYAAGLGYAELASRRPVAADTTFQIGSIGKSMTALAILRLVQAGRLDLNAPVSAHLPWFAMPSRFGPITLRHLLSHTAGLPAGTDFTPAGRYEGFALRDTEAAWEPGSRFHYSNTGYKLLGWLLEDVTGQDYGSVIRQRVLEPLGMNSTEPVITHATRHRMATGYVPLHDDRPYRRNDTLLPASWMEYPVGDGSQASTAGDMARYARLFLNGGRGDVQAVISPALYELMTAPAIAMARGDAYQHDYGYGFGIISHQADGHHFIGHGGSTVGFRAIMLTDQTDGLGVVIMCNGSDVDTYAPARYALQVAAAVRDNQPLPEPPPIPDPTHVADPARYAGDYVHESTGAILSVRAEDGRLQLHGNDAAGVALERISGHVFCAPHDAFDPFPLRFRPAHSHPHSHPTHSQRHSDSHPIHSQRHSHPHSHSDSHPAHSQRHSHPHSHSDSHPAHSQRHSDSHPIHSQRHSHPHSHSDSHPAHSQRHSHPHSHSDSHPAHSQRHSDSDSHPAHSQRHSRLPQRHSRESGNPEPNANTADDESPMVEIHHGPAVYVRRGNTPLSVESPYPPEWAAFPGHYRSHAPYVSNFRVILRRGRLYLAWPNGGGEPLTPHPSDSGPSPRFLVGPPGEPSAEWLRFDPVVGNQALRVIWAGGGSFYRV